MGLSAALNNVGRPGSVVEARATLWALHPAVAGVEFAAHAHREAVRLILADKLFGPQRRDVVNGRVVGADVDPARDVIEVCQTRMGLPHGDVVEAPHPVKLAVADERVAGEVKFRPTWKKYPNVKYR